MFVFRTSLLQICREENNRESFTPLSTYEQEWKTEDDIALANAIISHIHTNEE